MAPARWEAPVDDETEDINCSRAQVTDRGLESTTVLLWAPRYPSSVSALERLQYVKSRPIRLIEELAGLGLIARVQGDIYIFNPDVYTWQHVADPAAQVFFNGAVGITNATVNYTSAFVPYLPKITSCAQSTGLLPTSVCVGRTRLTVVAGKGTLRLVPALRICKVSPGLPEYISTLCIKPLVEDYPTDWFADNVCSISAYLAPVFTSIEEYKGLLWLVGNALMDPHSTSRFVIVYGPGGTGKSSLLRCLRTVLRGVCKAVDISGCVTSPGTRLRASVVEAIVSTRVVICGEVDFSSRPINSHFLKAITGNDPMALPPFDATLSATTFVASNSLPKTDSNTQWRSLSHVRRVYVLPMTVPAVGLPEASPEDTTFNCLNWAMRCVYVRLKYSFPPCSTRSVLMALYGYQYSAAVRLVEIDMQASRVESIGAAALLQRVLFIYVEEISDALAFYGPSKYFVCAGIRFISSIRIRTYRRV